MLGIDASEGVAEVTIESPQSLPGLKLASVL
jgi:hypothetical protein